MIKPIQPQLRATKVSLQIEIKHLYNYLYFI